MGLTLRSTSCLKTNDRLWGGNRAGLNHDAMKKDGKASATIYLVVKQIVRFLETTDTSEGGGSASAIQKTATRHKPCIQTGAYRYIFDMYQGLLRARVIGINTRIHDLYWLPKIWEVWRILAFGDTWAHGQWDTECMGKILEENDEYCINRKNGRYTRRTRTTHETDRADKEEDHGLQNRVHDW